MKRREFLLGAAAVAVIHAQERRRIRIAFLGASHPHASGKVDVVAKSPDWELVGIYEPDNTVMARYSQKGIKELTQGQVLEDPTIPVVAVESDIPEHASLGLAAVEAGKHVHLEKQPATNLEDLRRVLDLAERKGLLVQIGYMWRYNPAVNAALEAARAGWLGVIFFVRGSMDTDVDSASRELYKRFPGGQLFDLGGHMIDPMVRLMGRPEKVTPFLRSDGPPNDGLQDNTMAVFEWRKALGTFATASMHPRFMPYRTLEFVGTRGTAVVQPLEPPSLLIDLSAPAGPYQAGRQMLSYQYSRYVDDFRDLAAMVRGERQYRITRVEDILVHETLLRASGALV
jgi:predicted dehydrogenase